MYKKGYLLSRIKLILIILVVLSSFSGKITSAEGDGTGGGKSEPLMLVSSTLQNGATGVSLKPEIKLTFSKNIVNMTVNENNKKCFTLASADGVGIPIDVIFVDDQIEPEGRNDALIKVKDNLIQGTTYTLVISSGLKSKSGVTTGKETRLAFTTEGLKPVKDNTNTTPATPTPNTQKPPTTNSSNETIKTDGTNSTNKTNTANNTNKTNTANKTTTNEKPADTDQQTTVTDSKTTTNESDIKSIDNEEQNKPESEDMITAVNDEQKEKPIPYTAAETATDQKVKSNNSNSIIIIGIVVIGVVALSIIYFYRRKLFS
ncbi:Ig-like domain-containing protein [Neobacillus sp. FSL H8-0543]|uniref:Ig-like domain-containing protein n=1 Tax=Neobacillus sp. FSL H8-0543 TaxID=2954672 RepID=UPI003158D4C6